MKVAAIRKHVEPLHEAGYDLIPLDGKRPIQKDWVSKPRLSLPLLQQSLKTKADNVGMRLGRPLDDGRYLCVVDVDVLGTLSPEESTALADALGTVTGHASLDEAPSVKTGYGNESRHIYVATETVPRKALLAKAARSVEYVKAGASKNGPVWKIELMGYGAQVVIPPSVHPDTQASYRWIRGLNGHDQVPTVTLPQRQSRGTPGSQSRSSDTTESGPAAVLDDLSISPFYKLLMVDGDTQGNYPSRSEAVYAVISVLVRDTKLDDQQIAELVCRDEYNIGEKPREAPDPQSWVRDQVEKLRELAPKSGAAQIGASKLADDSDPVYKEVHERHSLVLWGGKPAVFRRRANAPGWESQYEIMTVPSLTTCYENKLVMEGTKMVNPVKLWRADPARKEYLEGAIMCPDGDTLDPGYFNLWQGYAVEPEKGDVSRFIEFMHKVLCNECEAHTEWLLDWTADLFQHTSNPKGVAIVMRGAEGIGKGTFANTLGHIIGAHFRHVTQESQLTGRFNAHFADSTLVFGDEMTWGGDKRNRGVLYSLITEKLLMVERKNFDAVPMRNLNRFIIASNNDWVVPTNIDGRRWFVLDPNESRKSDTTYFNKMRVWLENGGYRHILHYFLNRKITHDLRKAPVTQGLIDQKMNALTPIHQWWYECVERGSISPLAEGWPTDNTIEKERLYDYYKIYCKDVGVRIEAMTTFIRAVTKVVPMLEETRPREEGKRVRLLILPALNEAAEYLDGLFKQTLTS